MATPKKVIGQQINPAGVGRAGTITATLSQPAFVNGGEVVDPSVTVTLAADGSYAFDPAATPPTGLYSNSDLTPANTYYIITPAVAFHRSTPYPATVGSGPSPQVMNADVTVATPPATGIGYASVTGIPSGGLIVGTSGAAVAINPRGAWSNATAYAMSDAVTYAGNPYYATLAGTGHQPDVSPTYWSALPQVGLVGPAGTAGAAGAAGATGATGATGNPGLPFNFLAKTANFTAANGDYVEADATAAGFAVTLPASPAVGATVTVRKIDATANVVTVAPQGGGTIDSDANATITTQWYGATFEHAGSNAWFVGAPTTTQSGPIGPTGPTGAQGPAGTGGATVASSTQTASYVLALADAGTVVEMNVAGANTLTVPADASVAFSVGTVIEVFQLGAGQCTVTAAGGVTFRSDGALAKTAAQFSTISLRKRAANEWVLSGDLA